MTVMEGAIKNSVPGIGVPIAAGPAPARRATFAWPMRGMAEVGLGGEHEEDMRDFASGRAREFALCRARSRRRHELDGLVVNLPAKQF